MKETIYSIPINDAFDEKNGCPMCRLYSDRCEKALDYITGAAMMEPDVRMQSNKLGFCRQHLDIMLRTKKRLPVALMLESHLDDVSKNVYRSSKGAFSSSFDGDKLSQNALNQASSCFVCQRAQNENVHITENVIYMWKCDSAFQEKLRNQEYFCLEHLSSLLKEAKKQLTKRDLAEFVRDLSTVDTAFHEKLRENLSRFTKSFDYRYASEASDPEVKVSCEKALAYLQGKEYSKEEKSV